MPSSEGRSASRAASPTGWYSYAVIRVVPRPEREEFINAGVILFAPELRFLGAAIELDPVRVRTLAPEVELGLIGRQHCQAFGVQLDACIEETQPAAEQDHAGVDELLALDAWDDAYDGVVKRVGRAH